MFTDLGTGYFSSDYVALNIPQYPSIVKKPIDLGTIRQKLEGGRYPMPPFDAFEADMRLLFKNCYLFNPPGSPVNEWGQKLEEVFNRKWDERPTGEDDYDRVFSQFPLASFGSVEAYPQFYLAQSRRTTVSPPWNDNSKRCKPTSPK